MLKKAAQANRIPTQLEMQIKAFLGGQWVKSPVSHVTHP